MKYTIFDRRDYIILILVYSVITFNDFHIYNNLHLYKYTLYYCYLCVRIYVCIKLLIDMSCSLCN